MASKPETTRAERMMATLVVMLALFADYCLLTVVVPIFPEMKKELGLTNFAIGCLFAIKPLFQALTDPPLALLVNRGWVWPLAWGLLAEAGTTLIFAYAKSYVILMVSRACQGIASAFIMTTGLALVAKVYKHDDRDRGIALSRAFSGVALGVSLGPPLGGALYTAGGNLLTFTVLTGVVSLIFVGSTVFLIWHVRLRDERRRSKQLQQRDKIMRGAGGVGGTGGDDGCAPPPDPQAQVQVIEADSEASPSVEPRTDHNLAGAGLFDDAGAVRPPRSAVAVDTPALKRGRGPFRRILSDGYMVTVYGALLCANGGIGMLEPMISLWLEEDLHYEVQMIGFCYLGNTLASLLFSLLSGYLGNWFGRWRVIFFGIVILGVSFTVVSASGGQLWNIILSLVGMGVGMGVVDGCAPALLAQVGDLRHDASIYGSMYALSGVAASLGFIIGPLLGTGLMDAVGFSISTIVLGVVVAVYGPVMLIFRRLKFPKARPEVGTPTTKVDAVKDQELPPTESIVLAGGSSVEISLP